VRAQITVEIARAVLLSIGGGAALLWGLSSWFGKVWAAKNP